MPNQRNPGSKVSVDYRYGPELANRFSPVYISPMCSLYSQTRNVEAIRRLFRISTIKLLGRMAYGAFRLLP